MKCKACGHKENKNNAQFVGIFNAGSSFMTTEFDSEGHPEFCCLYGCPICGAVQFSFDGNYIDKKKEQWKKKRDEFKQKSKVNLK